MTAVMARRVTIWGHTTRRLWVRSSSVTMARSTCSSVSNPVLRTSGSSRTVEPPWNKVIGDIWETNCSVRALAIWSAGDSPPGDTTPAMAPKMNVPNRVRTNQIPTGMSADVAARRLTTEASVASACQKPT